MNKKIVVVDYGLGNIISAQQSFLKIIKDNKITAEVIVSNDPEVILRCSHIVLPGQGAFLSCIDGLRKIPKMIQVLEKNIINYKKPFLGICVGMQLLADTSYENGTHQGLGWISGSIKKLSVGKLKLPHMGWNNVKLNKNLFNKTLSFEEKDDFYFVHSYYFDCFDQKNIIATTNYGINFPSIIGKENIYGVQFHPEKSSEQGLELIKNFILL